MELPVQQFRTKAEQAYLDMFAAAEKALPGAGDPFGRDCGAKAIDDLWPRSACRIAASRPGNIPTSAPG